MSVVHTSRMRIEKHEGPLRTAHLEGFPEPIHFGINRITKLKHGREIAAEYPTTLHHIIAGVACCLTGTLGAALDVLGIKAADNLVAQVEGDIEDVDGVMRITKIRLHYRFRAPGGSKEQVDRVLAGYAEKCPAYQSVKGCIDCSWDAEIVEG